MTADEGVRPRVKVCGVTHPTDVETVAAAGADAIGIITDVPVDTPRAVSGADAAALVETVPPFLTSVLVTMAETAPPVLELLETVGPDAVQLHGGLPPDELAAVASAHTTIAAHSVADAAAIRSAAEIADAVLLDSVDESGAGGTGRTHNWDRARSWVNELDVPVILAGGLHPDNVGDAVGAVAPYGVDVATGVASDDDPARKERRAVRAFVATANGRREVLS